jgi:hypothetical protein
MNSTPPPITRSDSDLPKNIFPHILRNREYDLEFLKWALAQKFLDGNTLRDINNRINEIENGEHNRI